MSKENNDKEFSLRAVPTNHRIGFWNMMVVMLGFTFFSASMMGGGTIGTGLDFTQFLLVVMAGNLLLGLYTGALAYAASKTGLSTHLLTKYAFGEKGSYLASFLLSITQIGWFGVGVAMFALPVQKVTGIDTYILIILAGILMSSSAYFGMKSLAVISFISVPLIVILGSFSVFKATQTVGGVDGILSYSPTESIGLAAALSICIGSFISGGTLTADFTRFARTKRSAVITTVIAFFLGNSLMFLFGAVGAISTGVADVSEVMFLQGLILPAIIVLGLNIWTTNDNALYASGLGISNITKIKKSKVVIFNGILGTVMALWLYNNFVGFLNFLNLTLPPIGAILLADFFLLNRGKYKEFEKMTFKSVNWLAIIAWIIGVIGAKFIPGVPSVNAVIGSAGFYLIASMIQRKLASTIETETKEAI
ncbi:cytosine permease [Peribacillus glennii]|uniref:Cytosine permease n=1 Tax=Peribacillus glennii TaxID=2303991 RepID=A0A372LFU6_9BACI|nr:cytosine permease [Peribacillus glennii]RFU65165.1 cytosine permease [Peribacillus glennii]